MRDFYSQVVEFCQLLQEELMLNLEDLTQVATSAPRALGFAECLILCPTAEAGRGCIRNDLGGALSFLLALEGVNTRIHKSGFDFPSEWPEHQTRFYVLCCSVQQYLDSLHAKAA
jgi:hypothetical protein